MDTSRPKDVRGPRVTEAGTEAISPDEMSVLRFSLKIIKFQMVLAMVNQQAWLPKTVVEEPVCVEVKLPRDIRLMHQILDRCPHGFLEGLDELDDTMASEDAQLLRAYMGMRSGRRMAWVFDDFDSGWNGTLRLEAEEGNNPHNSPLGVSLRRCSPLQEEFIENLSSDAACAARGSGYPLVVFGQRTVVRAKFTI